MKQVVILFFLASLLGVSYASRFIITGIINDAKDAFIASSKSDPIFTSNEENNIFAFAVGDSIPVDGGINTPPFAAILAAKGYIDYTTKTQFSYTDFNGVAAAFAFLYFGIGEYCEVNNVPGYQENSTDYVIQYKNYTQATFAPLTNYINGTTYGVTLTESSGIFTLKCRACTDDRMDGGITVSAYSVKCDVLINATLFWAPSTLCPVANRYVGLVAYMASAAADTTDLDANPDADGQNAFYDSAQDTFFKFLNKVTVSDILQDYDIVASVISVHESFPLPDAIKDIRRVFFSFLSPKSNNGNIFFFGTHKLELILHFCQMLATCQNLFGWQLLWL